MARGERSIIIERPVNDVFSFLADPANIVSWRSAVASVVPISTSSAATTPRYRLTLRGRDGNGRTSEIELSSDNTRLVIVVTTLTGSIRPTITFGLFPETAETTRVDCTVLLEPSGLLRFAGAILDRGIASELDHLVELKQHLERV